VVDELGLRSFEESTELREIDSELAVVVTGIASDPATGYLSDDQAF
jgi:hypothetical protein